VSFGSHSGWVYLPSFGKSLVLLSIFIEFYQQHTKVSILTILSSYVGAQESISTSFNAYVTQAFPSNINTTTWQAIGHSCFAAGRFLAASLSFFIKPRYLLLFFFCGSLALSVVAMHYKGTAPQTAVMLLYFFEGPIFSLIYANCLRGLGKWTKDGNALLAAAISGGAAWPPIMYGAVKGGHKSYQYAYCVVAAAFAVGTLLPL
jgi:fucose permease